MKPARIGALHAALLLGTVSLALPALAGTPPVAPTHVFAPPEGEPMLLTRTLRRELFDGKAIVATRRYRVHFTRTPDGWTIEGSLVASEIDAPPALAGLAAIERQRPDDALFPIRLDAAGVIQPRDGTASPDGPAWRAALDHAIALASARPASAIDGAALDLLIQQMQAVVGAATLSRWPTTLFLPEPGTSREERRFALPGTGEGAGEGAILAELERMPAEGTDTMGWAERRVVTEVAGTRRVTREQWSLERIGG